MGLAPFPSVPFALDTEAVRAAYRRVRGAIAVDPLFIDEADDFDVSIEALDAKMLRPVAHAEELVAAFDGPDQYRYALLKILLEAFPTAPARVLPHGVSIADGQVLLVPGDLRVEGPLRLEGQGALIVLGTLEAKHLLASAWDYTLVAARAIRIHAGISMAELIAAEEIVAHDRLYLGGNDYSCRAPFVKAGTLVDFERENFFTRVEAETRVTQWDFSQAAVALGLAPDATDVPRAFFEKLARESLPN